MKHAALLILFILQTVILPAEEARYSIQGKIYNISSAPVYIFLVDEAASKVPFTGIKQIIVPDSHALKKGFVRFIFNDVPGGIYGIRCFQDQNNNGKLDRGLFGPSEPWGLSWNNNRTSGWPGFKNFNFTLKSNMDKINIYLKRMGG